jgi:hypothetical protein
MIDFFEIKKASNSYGNTNVDAFYSFHSAGGYPCVTIVAIVKPPKTTKAPKLNRTLRTFLSLIACTVPIAAKIPTRPKITINKFM